MPVIFSTVYHEKIGIAGLHYIALGIGLSVASQVSARYMDRIYIHFKNKNGGVGEPEFRLRQLGVFLYFRYSALLTFCNLGESSVDDSGDGSLTPWAAAYGVVGA